VSRIRPPGGPQTANPTTDGKEKTPAERPLAGLGAYDVDANVLSDPMKPADAASQAHTAQALAPILPIARRRNGVEAPNDIDRAKSLEADDAAALAASPASAQAANLAPVAQPAAQQSIVPPAVVQQMVEFAAVHRGRDGVVEFRLGMNRDVLGGVRLQLLSYGRKRMGIRVLRDDAGALNDADLAAIVQTLRSKGIDVIEASLGA
jgi:hypothetical protein